MPSEVTLVTGLSVAVGTSLLTSLLIWFNFVRLVNDEAGIRLMRGLLNNNRPGWLVTFVLTGTGLVVAWIAGFFMPLFMSRTLADLPLVIALGVFAGATGWLYWIDATIRRLPNRIVFPVTAIMVLAFLLSLILGVNQDSAIMNGLWAKSGTPALSGLVSAGVLVAVFAIIYLVGMLFNASTVGMGDVKLAIPVGLVAGCLNPWGLLVAIIVMNVTAIIHWLKKRWEQKPGAIAYGPHMLTGGWAAAILTPLFL